MTPGADTVTGGRGRLALVTGGAGFIGSHLVDELLGDGWRVRVLDDFSTGRAENLGDVIDEIEIVRADICDSEAVESAAHGADVIFHEAAVASVPRSFDEPLHTHAVNLGGTLRVLEAARRRECRRVVFASSSAVYGNADRAGGSVREDDPQEPISPYAVQKLAAEHYLRVYATLHGVETVALRYFNVYGDRQSPGGDYAAVVPIFAARAVGGQPLVVHGDGQQTRDFIHVSDVARGNRLAADAANVSGGVFNMASGRGTRVIELVSVLEAVLGRPLEVIHAPGRRGDVRESQAVVEAARKQLGFVPGIDLERGIRHIIDGLGESASIQEASQ